MSQAALWSVAAGWQCPVPCFPIRDNIPFEIERETPEKENRTMPKYMVRANYSNGGATGLLDAGGTGRRDAVKAFIESAGGQVEAFYYCFGEYDVLFIADLPNNVSVAALSLVSSASGAVETVTTPLLTAEEIDEAVKKASTLVAPALRS